MQTIYIADLPLAADRAATWQGLQDTVERWIDNRLEVHLGPDAPAATSPDGNAEARRQGLAIDATSGWRVVRWDTRQSIPATPAWRYHVTVWVSQNQDRVDGLSVRCRLGIESTTGQVAPPDVPLGRPGVVRDVLEHHQVVVDDRRVGSASVLGTSEIPQLLALLQDPYRRLPVVVMTPSPRTGRPWCDADKLASGLGGLAHVVVLSARTTSFALTDALGTRELAVWGGAVRLYWPGFSKEDGGRQHPVWFDARLQRTTPQSFTGQVFEMLGRVSAIALGAPEIERRLVLEDQRRRQRDASERMRRLADQLAERTRDVETAKASAIDERWFADYEETLEDAETVANERDALQFKVEELQDELTAVRQAFADVQRASGGSASNSAVSATDEGPCSSITEAVERAETQCPNLVFLPEAYRSAEESQYPDPDRVLQDLVTLNTIVAEWQTGGLAGGFKETMARHGISGYRDGISQVAATKYETDYRRTYLDQQVLLGPHIAHGTGAPRSIMRLYWYVDNENKTLVVGHVGRKLRDDSNK